MSMACFTLCIYTCCDFIASILFAVYRCNYCMALTVIILMLPYGRFQLTLSCQVFKRSLLFHMRCLSIISGALHF